MVYRPRWKNTGNFLSMCHSVAISDFQITLGDFKYWEMYPTIEQMKEGEDSFLYPPRFKVICIQTDTAKRLHFTLEVSKRFVKDKETKIKSIGKILIIRETKGIVYLATILVNDRIIQKKIFTKTPFKKA